jgi:hypothetical protein
MVMIDLSDEKKSLGVISVTRVTSSSLLQRADQKGPLAFEQVRYVGIAVVSDQGVPMAQLAPVKKK